MQTRFRRSEALTLDRWPQIAKIQLKDLHQDPVISALVVLNNNFFKIRISFGHDRGRNRYYGEGLSVKGRPHR
ncbi:hypothetical protein MPTK1_6g08450 [Marchantia polymorpha subsp. ruderalis]|uniref:Uncharacterized protein n=2 Tax=Marchantia polymorpha TaxID=3197 RepID=A0AAF6BPW7_MARPO|nr:hypothetical protein MARPO_0060s0076 [Marchantia polymorpha]BBN14051.1 hypothetical protein Mp_6g08450 [Marchantia polymorpha subsp. ruderalis]|eukprot:PTQ36994.1 hypothetical protein MARPO_0060s0076 [Marchantia polymorpha]